MACCLVGGRAPTGLTLRDRLRSRAGVRQGSPCSARLKLVRAARQSTLKGKAGPSDVLLLDFDGVVVDSEPEVKHKRHKIPQS